MNRSFLFAALALASLAAAETEEIRPAAASPFQYVPASARVAALGTNPAWQGGAALLSLNPAGLAAEAGKQLSLDVGIYPGQIQRQGAGLGLSLGSLGALGLGLGTVDYGSVDLTDETGQELGAAALRDIHVDLGWAFSWERLDLGLQLSARHEDFAGEAQWLPFTGLGLGLDLPARLRAGLSWLQPVGPTGQQGLARLGLSAQPWPGALLGLATGLRSGVGQELQFSLAQRAMERLELRAGYRLAWPDDQLGALAGLSLGLGFSVQAWRVDYAFLPLGDFGQIHQLSLALSFGAGAAKITTSTQPQSSPQPVPEAKPLAPVQSSLSLQILSPLVTQGLALQRESRWVEAANLLRQAVLADPKDAAAWRALAASYAHLGHTDYARQCYSQLLSLEPNDQAAQDWLRQSAQQTP